MIATGDMDVVERQLALFARVALEPDPAGMARIRAALLREAQVAPAQRARAARTDPVALPGIERAARRLPFRGWTTGRLAGALAAAALTGLVLGGSVFASSRAGGPLYDARVWLESVTLPADPGARLEAEIARAQTRLAEAAAADAAGDGPAVVAALGAYSRIVDQTLAEGGAAVDGAERAALAFRGHQSVLSALQATLQQGSAAADALANALDRSSRAIDRLGGGRAGAPDPAASPDAGSPAEPARPGEPPRPSERTPTGEPEGTPAARPTDAGPPDDPGSPGRGSGSTSESSSGGGRPSDAGRPSAPPPGWGNGGN